MTFYILIYLISTRTNTITVPSLELGDKHKGIDKVVKEFLVFGKFMGTNTYNTLWLVPWEGQPMGARQKAIGI